MFYVPAAAGLTLLRGETEWKGISSTPRRLRPLWPRGHGICSL